MQRRRFITRTLSASLTGAALASAVLSNQRAVAAVDALSDAAAQTAAADSAAATSAGSMAQARTPISPLLPAPLRRGDTVALIAPATAAFQQDDLDIARESLEALGLRVRIGAHARDRHGSLGGLDADRAADLNASFADPEIRGIFPVRGGWGSARLLPLLDYDQIRANPKVLLGYSDITALLNGIHARTGLVTFHGPNAGGRWDEYSLDIARRVLFDGEALRLTNPRGSRDENVLTETEFRRITITPGRASGRLLGGNLSVLTTLLGSPWMPDFTDAILFLEDVGENWYRIDRMLTALRLAGVLDTLAGFVFGSCAECEPGAGFASLTPEEIFADHIGSMGIPAWRGAMIGHGQPQWTLPVGTSVTIDADAGTLLMNTPGVAKGSASKGNG
ncbi:MAG: S66 peptidase family protein [Pseudomonadales bacterium]